MTTSETQPGQQIWRRAAVLPPDAIETIATAAAALDQGERSARENIRALAGLGVLGLGAAGDDDGGLPAMAAVLGELAAECMSTAFAVWAHRMTIQYLTVAGTAWAAKAASLLASGAVLGVTGMASAFKDAAGCGSLDLTATADGDGYVLDGTLRWASNLYRDSILVTAARTDTGEKLIVGLALSTDGVTIGDHFDLLALGSTASSYLKLDNAAIGADQVLSREVGSFLARVRPTFLLLQSAMCLGLAGRCVARARVGLTGVNSVFAAEVETVSAELSAAESTLAELAPAVGTPAPPGRRELLSLRLAAAALAGAAAALEVRTAGGKGYALRTGASRRFREAAFIPVQSPAESQLRWELDRCA
ncbi:acyl-CoA dehydrogenase [Nocardia panacis]|uniref:Acyl-CoA dehydrogenase n=1 Tax=Nocardia panacis TaxID=2340916 RepID=A0A3A4K0A2_9NOCA|nr:acyl-CoA dehydrogenase family protein [Nocardia panacis]RJO70653.1 acyl-CoA dehydrogenase [Nocardia panacis]